MTDMPLVNGLIYISLSGLALLALFQIIQIVQQQTLVVVETFGRFSSILTPGLNIVFWPFQMASGKLSLQIRQHVAHIDIKTADNAFVQLPVSIQFKVIEAKAYEAFYTLRAPEEQIKTWVLNSMRSITAKMTLNELFNDRMHIEEQIQGQVADQLAEYGYELVRILIDQPMLPDTMQSSFNAVIESHRHLEAAKQQRDIAVQVAEGEADAQRARAKGLGDARTSLAKSMSESMDKFKDAGVDGEQAMQLLTETNRIDALREIAKHGNLIITDLNKESGDGSAKLAGVLAARQALKSVANDAT